MQNDMHIRPVLPAISLMKYVYSLCSSESEFSQKHPHEFASDASRVTEKRAIKHVVVHSRAKEEVWPSINRQEAVHFLEKFYELLSTL